MQVAELAYVGAFQEMIHQIVERNPLQRKALTPYLASRDEVYRRQASDFAKRLEQYLSSVDLGLDYAVAAYLELCQDVLIETISFGRTGAYSCRCQRDAYRDVYTNAAAMRSYMVGLAVSQFLWRNHYEMYSFFKSTTEKRCRQVTRYLEIGPGPRHVFGRGCTNLSYCSLSCC